MATLANQAPETSTKANYASLGAGGGSGLGAALAEIVIAFVPQLHEHELAVTVIFSAIVAAAAAWITTRLAPRNRPI